MSDGPDVKQLEKNLKELGFANGLSVDEKFTDGTADAVKRWQKAHKLEETGKIGTGQISMLPFKELRIDSVTALPGSAVGSTDAMKVTGTDVQVTVPLQETQLSQVAPGSKVTVQLPGGKKSDGTVKSVERGGSDAAPDKKPGSGDSAGTAVVTLADPGDSQAGASVSVTLADTSVDNALIVPVTSLLALSEGGYGVQVVRNGATVLVPVTIGLITDAKVQVTGGDVHEGDQVVIPK
jgi:peptidoglycan hydrolase-like protein with peptidoglycan-binding domain